MSENFAKQFLKDLKIDNLSLAEDAISAAEVTGYLDTGCYALNALLSGSIYGGLPNNKITAFAGETTTGKTFLVLGIVKQFLQDNSEGFVIYNDTESAVTSEMMSSRGIDISRVIIAEPETIQQFRTNTLNMLEKYGTKKDQPPMLMVLDSLGQLSSTKELEDTSEGKETKDMTKAQVIKATFRVLTLKLARAGVPLILTNHVYDEVGAFYPTKQISGGSGLKYSASTIIMLGKSKDKEGKDVVGNIIRAKAFKSRFTKENKEVLLKLSYTKGLDPYYGLLSLAEKYSIIKKISTRYEFSDGTKVFGKHINENPKKYFTPEIMKQIDQAALLEFTYGEKNEQSNNIIEERDGESD